MATDFDKLWTKLVDYPKTYFYSGMIVRFRTNATAGDEYKYAIATRIDGCADLSFVGMDGGTWGYGRCTLPQEARHKSRPYTVSQKWLIENFEYIAIPSDADDIFVCPDALQIMDALEKYTKKAGRKKR